MKKLFTLACGALLAMSASAAEFGFCDKDGKFFEDGATITLGYETEEIVPDFMYEYKMDPDLYLKGQVGVSYTLNGKMPEECRTAWGCVQICWGQCIILSNGTYTRNSKLEAETEALQIHYSLISYDGTKPTENATLSLWVSSTDNPSDKKTLTVNFIAKPAEEVAGIASVGVDINAPVQYFNILGVEVKNPQKGQILIRRQGNVAQKVIF